LSLVV